MSQLGANAEDFGEFFRFLAEDDATRKIFVTFLVATIVAALCSFIWVFILRFWQNSIIKTSLIFYHIFLLFICLWVFIDRDAPNQLIIGPVLTLALTDIYVWMQRRNLPFAEAMCKIG